MSTRIKPISKGQTESKLVANDKQFVQTTKGNVQVQIKQPFKKGKIGKISTVYVEKGVKGKSAFKTKGELIGEAVIGGKKTRFKFSSKGNVRPGKVTKGLRISGNKRNLFADISKSRKVNKVDSVGIVRTKKVINLGKKTKLKPLSRSITNQKELYSIKQKGLTTAEYKGDILTSTKKVTKPITVNTKYFREGVEVVGSKKLGLKSTASKMLSSKKAIRQQFVPQERLVPVVEPSKGRLSVQPSISSTTVAGMLQSKLAPKLFITPFAPITTPSVKTSIPNTISTKSISIQNIKSPTIENIKTDIFKDNTKISSIDEEIGTTPSYDISTAITPQRDTSPISIIQPSPFIPSPVIPSPITPPPPITPTITPPPLPFFGGRSGGGFGGLSRTRIKQKKGFTPTARAAVFGLKGKTSKGSIVSGLGGRFIKITKNKKKKLNKWGR